MMLDQHHDDETLIALLEAGDTNDVHLRSCEDCAGTLTALRDISSSLKDADVWERKEFDERPIGQTISMLRAAADQLQDGVGRAADLTDELLKLRADEAERLVRIDTRYHTPGVARRLFDISEAALDFDPRRALDISTLSVAAAESLTEAHVGSETLALLRGPAYRHHGFALFYAGRYPEALRFFERADAALEGSISAVYEKGRVGIHRAVVYVNLERIDEAMAAARQSQRAFSEFQDSARLSSARFAEAYVLIKVGHWRQALGIFQAIQRDSMHLLDDDLQARVHTNMGLCHRSLGEPESAARQYYLASALFEQAGTKSEAARMRWQLAELARAERKFEEALRRFDEVAFEFVSLGMVSEAASVHLETAETILEMGQFDRVEDLCRAAIRQYEVSGLGYSSKALAALSYLGDVAKHQRATTDTVRHVRDYLRRLPQEPALLFAPLPEDLSRRG